MPVPHYAMSALQEVQATGIAPGNRPLFSAASKVVKLASSLVFSSLVLYETALIFLQGRYICMNVDKQLSSDRYAEVA